MDEKKPLEIIDLTSLRGQFLAASPAMDDPRFSRGGGFDGAS